MIAASPFATSIQTINLERERRSRERKVRTPKGSEPANSGASGQMQNPV